MYSRYLINFYHNTISHLSLIRLAHAIVPFDFILGKIRTNTHISNKLYFRTENEQNFFFVPTERLSLAIVLATKKKEKVCETH